MKRYYSRVDTFIASLAWIPIIIGWVICIPILMGGFSTAMIVVSVTLASSTILIASIFTSTYYSIDSEYLYWRTGPFYGKIEIKNIMSVGRYDSMLGISSIMKPALAKNPLKIQFGKYDDMPFSPKDEKEFIAEILNHKSDLIIKEELNVSGQLEESVPS